MRTPRIQAFSLLFLLAGMALAEQPMCGTSAENDARLRAMRERRRLRFEAHASPAATLRDGAIYLQADESLVAGYRPFDLDGVSLVFEPRGPSSFAMRRESLRYVEPSSAPIADFHENNATPFYVTRDLGFTFPIFGRSITRVHLSAFNAIHFDDPVRQGATQFDDLEAAVHRGAVLSPLMITAGKPRYLAYPQVFVEERPDALIVTWRSSAGAEFGYDVQAELRSDGMVTYSYRTVHRMRWGAPVVSAGFDPESATRTSLGTYTDVIGETGSTVPANLRPMLDVTSVDVSRLSGSDLFSVRVKLAAAIAKTSIPSGQTLQYAVTVDGQTAFVDVDRSSTRVTSFTSTSSAADGASARVAGDVVEVFGIQHDANGDSSQFIRVSTFYRPTSGVVDQANFGIPFTVAPRRVASDLSDVGPDATLTLPIVEPFVLGSFDPMEVFERVQAQFALSDYDIDAVAMYQTFFTDIIFFAGAYATRGNAQVNGIALPSNAGTNRPRAPTLLHLNQLTYNYSSAPTTASKVMLHELGHRWLYFISIDENGQTSRVLNPLSAHPAAYVHTPSVYRVYEEGESSVMGGGSFTQEPDGRYRARALNHGYSWTDLYLMGLAAREEVQPWFYLAGTDPALPQAYWPEDGVVVSGEKRSVAVDQIIAVHGQRDPSVALSQKRFRVVFVLVTEEGKEPTEAEVAKINEWRALLQRNFAIATGGRAWVDTRFVRLGKRRGVR